MQSLVVIAHNIRSTHNVGALFRTCDGFGVDRLVLSGYTPYPTLPNDTRLPHIRDAQTKHIHKTALGAERTVTFTYTEHVDLDALRREGYVVVGLEQSPDAQQLPAYSTPDKIAVLLGEEVEGIPQELLAQCDALLEIPMYGAKESYNVSVAAGIALYHLRCVGVH